ncbi:MAG: ATP-binding response regulator, partial [Pyrinomonadaceae bacterium]
YTENTLEHAITVIGRSARTQQQLIEDLLDSARIISGKLRLEIQPVNLLQLIEMAVEIMRPAAEAKRLALRTFSETEMDVITGDPTRLQQVIVNLLSNAVKFTSEGGSIEVHSQQVDSSVRITINDTGKGIGADMLPFVFDRFHQADSSSTRRYSGLGLGLSLVRHLIELHGGTINAESPGEGQGATFNINLPIRAVRTSVEDLAANADSFKPYPTFEGLRILVVDDEIDAREMVAYILEQYGARVTPAASAAEALAEITVSKQRYDLIISDIGMPDEDGYSLIRRVRALGPEQGGQIPAIALTAYGLANDRARALRAGFQMHQSKPVKLTELLMAVTSLTGRKATALE